MRIDQWLVQRGLATSRTLAQKWLAEGRVEYLDNGRWMAVTRASQQLGIGAEIRLREGTRERYVSRGGHKLEAALHSVDRDWQGIRCLDIGQSTGGFTDCLLQHGAALVVGLEVGHGQLHPSLANRADVVCLEGVNARQPPYMQLMSYVENKGFDLVVIDVSFISQTLILPGLKNLLAPGGLLISLVKPQFEAGPAFVGKGGIIRDPAAYVVVEQRLRECLTREGWRVRNWLDSPIAGGDGNREFLAVADRE